MAGLSFRKAGAAPGTVEYDLEQVNAVEDRGLRLQMLARVVQSRPQEVAQFLELDESGLDAFRGSLSRRLGETIGYDRESGGAPLTDGGALNRGVQALAGGLETVADVTRAGTIGLPQTLIDAATAPLPQSTDTEAMAGVNPVRRALAPMSVTDPAFGQQSQTSEVAKRMLRGGLMIGPYGLPAVAGMLDVGAQALGGAVASAWSGSSQGAPTPSQFLEPMRMAGEVITSAPAAAASAVGYDPAKLPIMARTEAYLADLGRRVGDTPEAPVIGATMAGGPNLMLRRHFGRGPRPAAGPGLPEGQADVLQLPPGTGQAAPIQVPPGGGFQVPEMVTPPALGPEALPPAAPVPQLPPGRLVPGAWSPADPGGAAQAVPQVNPRRPQPVQYTERPEPLITRDNAEAMLRAQTQPVPDSPAAPPAVAPTTREAVTVRPDGSRRISIKTDAPPEVEVTDLSRPVDPDTIQLRGPVEAKRIMDEVLDPELRKEPTAAELEAVERELTAAMAEADRMVAEANRGTVSVEETQVAPGKKRISMKVEGRPTATGRIFTRGTGRGGGGRPGRGRSGAFAMPTMPTLAQARQGFADAVWRASDRVKRGVGAVESRLRQKPRHAPMPGTPGGPGVGTPFRLEALPDDVLIPISDELPASGTGRVGSMVKDLVGRPATSDGSAYSRSGITRLGVMLERMGNTMRMDMERFVFGDEAGRVWLRDQVEKAGPVYWEAFIRRRTGDTLAPEHVQALAQHADLTTRLDPFLKLLDHVRSLKLTEDMPGGDRGPRYWPHLWGQLSDVGTALRDAALQKTGSQGGSKFNPTQGPITGERTTFDAPARNLVDVAGEYMDAIVETSVRRQALPLVEAQRVRSSAYGRKLIEEWMSHGLYRKAWAVDKAVADTATQQFLESAPMLKTGDSFDADGTFGYQGRIEVGGESYFSERRGPTFRIKMNGRELPVSYSALELAAMKAGGDLPGRSPVSTLAGAWNSAAAHWGIAMNLRSFFRQISGGQARFVAETAITDYASGHRKALDYWMGKLSPDDMRMLDESGITSGDTVYQGFDLKDSKLGQYLFANVAVPDTQTKVAAFFAEMERLTRETPGLSREARMDAASEFALRVSDWNIASVQTPGAAHPVANLIGLFQKSRFREVWHAKDMLDRFRAGERAPLAKYVATKGAILALIAKAGDLNDKEWRALVWSEIPFGEFIGTLFGDKSRHNGAFGAAALDMTANLAVNAMDVLRDAASPVPTGSNWRDRADEYDRRARKVMPAAYRTASDLVRLVGGSDTVSNQARTSLVTAPVPAKGDPKHQTQFQKNVQKRNQKAGGRRLRRRSSLLD